MIEKELDEKVPGDGRGWSCKSLGAVRHRLVALIQDFQQGKSVDKDEIARFRALVYGYSVLSSVVKDQELDDLTRRLDALEAKEGTK